MPLITSATNIEEAIDHAMKQVVVHVGTELLHGNGMLLVSAHELLCHNAMESLHGEKNQAGYHEAISSKVGSE